MRDHRNDPDCEICQLIALQSDRIGWLADNEHALALVPSALRAAGAVVVAPKRHATSVFDLSEAEAKSLMRLVMVMYRGVQSAFDPEGMNLWWDTGLAADQPIAHAIVEIVPRFAHVPYRFTPFPLLKRCTAQEQGTMAIAIQNSLSEKGAP